jgi:hypothetical protein
LDSTVQHEILVGSYSITVSQGSLIKWVDHASVLLKVVALGGGKTYIALVKAILYSILSMTPACYSQLSVHVLAGS